MQVQAQTTGDGKWYLVPRSKSSTESQQLENPNPLVVGGNNPILIYVKKYNNTDANQVVKLTCNFSYFLNGVRVNDTATENVTIPANTKPSVNDTVGFNITVPAGANGPMTVENIVSENENFDDGTWTPPQPP